MMMMMMMNRKILLVILACELRWESIKATNREIKSYIFVAGYSAFTI